MNLIEISANEFISLLNKGIEGEKTYKISDKLILSGNAAYRCNKSALIAKEGVIIKDADGLSITDLTIMGDVTIDSDSRNILIYKCEILGNVTVGGKNCTVRSTSANSIKLLPPALNCLVAQNDVEGDISVDGAYNCSIILNLANTLAAADTTNVYVIDNKIADQIIMTGNKHLISDGNSFATVVNTNNSLFNGDTLQDVDARLEVGADENLLPHTNKDLFIGMERKETLLDPETLTPIGLNEYIAKEALGNDVVIVPPGAYSVTQTLVLEEAHSNTSIYAYGVYQEATNYIKCVGLMNVSNLKLMGLTVGYTKVSAGQIQVLDKLGDNKLLVISSAGFPERFGKLDPATCHGGGYFYHPGKHYQWTELGYWGTYTVVPNENGEELNEDGSFVMQISNNGEEARYYNLIEKGELFSCRMVAVSDRTASISNCTNVIWKDTVTYGYAAALCFVIGGTSKGVEFYRHHNLSHSAYEIDKETYDKYKALEEKYNVDLEVYIDELGRYRGAKPRMGSVDATHITGSSQGLSATSTLFENACDDATNQRSESSCLHKIIDNSDGTYTIIYKDNMPSVYYHLYKRRGKTNNPGMKIRHFLKGEKIFAYASNGKVLCDTRVLEDATIYEKDFVMYEEDYEFKGEMLHMKWLCDLYAVKVNASDVNISAVEGYNTEISEYTMDNKVIVDNVSRNSTDFVFDNCMTRHNRGRVIIKTRDAVIKNCTFTDNSYAGVIMSVESTWGESSVPMNITVDRCLFDGVSREYDRNHITKYAALAVEGLGDRSDSVIVSENTIPAKNIAVTNNVFRNVQNDYYVTFSATQDVTVKNNVFEKRSRTDLDNIPGAIYINGCMNIDVSYNTFATDINRAVVGKNYKALTGNDVDGMIPADAE